MIESEELKASLDAVSAAEVVKIADSCYENLRASLKSQLAAMSALNELGTVDSDKVGEVLEETNEKFSELFTQVLQSIKDQQKLLIYILVRFRTVGEESVETVDSTLKYTAS